MDINKTVISLRQLELSDSENIVKWRNSQFVKNNLFSQSDLTIEQHINYFNNVVQTGKCKQYIITANVDEKIMDVGTIFIKNIDYDNKKAEYGIFIGEEEARGKGYAKLATQQILNIAFNELNLNRIYLQVLSNNERAIEVYKKVGFQPEGILRQDYYRDGCFFDVIIMGILKETY